MRNNVKRWKRVHEQSAMLRLTELRNVKKVEVKASKENARKIARKIPVELLAKEWLTVSEASVETRAYILDKVMPTLILGVEKLLNAVNERGLTNPEAAGGFDPDFNPINFLAQYLHRNNPRYSNFSEASPYVRGMRQVTEELKAQLFDLEDNRLARLKAEAKRKRADRELLATLKQQERDRRHTLLSNQFAAWKVPTDKGRVELSLVQNALRSFMEVAAQFPPEIEEVTLTQFSQPLESTDQTGTTLSVNEFAQYLLLYIDSLPSEVFDNFMDHLSKCATAHQESAERENRRVVLTNLFIYCDHSGIGLLDRHRILSLFEQFWDVYEDSKKNFINPRRWPVVEVDEADDSLNDEEEPTETDHEPVTDNVGATEIETAVETENSTTKKSSLDNRTADVEEKTDNEAETADKEKEPEENVIEISDEAHEKSVDETAKEKESQDVDEKEKDEMATDPELAQEVDISGELPKSSSLTQVAKPTTAITRGQSITFAHDTAFERAKTALTAHSSARTQSQMSAFDESNLNVSQFVQLTETFLGEHASETGFNKLLAFIREGYEETEDEKMDRLMKAHKEAVSAHRRIQLDTLFENWDNDSCGYLDIDEVEEIMLKYKEGLEKEVILSAIGELKRQSKYSDNRLNKKEFRTLVNMVADKLSGADGFEYFVNFLASNVERSYAERVRGEARKKWLNNIMVVAKTSGVSLDPIYRAVFQALYQDAEAHGGEKKISVNVALLERNIAYPERGDMMLRYSACTPEDAEYVLNRTLYKDMKGVSFSCVETGQPIHVPRVNAHGNLHFWNEDRLPEEREGSFIVLPLKDKKRRVFGVLGIDTMTDPHSKAIFITHEIQYFQGVSQMFSTAYHLVEMKHKLLRITESAISWIKRRSPNVTEIMVYLVEPGTGEDYVLRRMMTTDKKGFPIYTSEPAVKLERKDNLFRDYLFKAVDNSETVTADAYGNRQLAYPLRDDEGKAIAVVDISTGSQKKLPTHENKEIQRMLRLLNQAHKEITREFYGEEKLQILDAEKDDETRMEIMFDRLMLMELRENVAKLDAEAYAELRAYNNPPEIILHILRATLVIFYKDLATQGEFDDWANVRTYINNDLSQKIQAYDPTSPHEILTTAAVIEAYLTEVPHGEVAKHGSLPAQHLYNWVFVCLSLIEHTRKMQQNNEDIALELGLTTA